MHDPSPDRERQHREERPAPESPAGGHAPDQAGDQNDPDRKGGDEPWWEKDASRHRPEREQINQAPDNLESNEY